MEDQLDDLIVEAQDAYFDGNLNQVIESCEKALQIRPREGDAYELLTLSLMQLNQPQYDKTVKTCLNWGQNCFESTKQLKTLMRASYHADDKTNLLETCKKLTKITEVDLLMDFALAAAFTSDMGEIEMSKELANYCSLTESEELSMGDEQIFDKAELTRTKVLLLWSQLKSNPELGVDILEKLLESTPSDTLGIGLLHALIIVYYLELKAFQDAQRVLKRAEESGFVGEENVQGAKALLLHFTANGQLQEIKNLALDAAPRSNDLIRKRLEKEILTK